MFRERLFHHLRLLTVAFFNFCHVPVVKAGFQRTGEKLLQQVRRAEIVVAFNAQDGREEWFGQKAKTNPHAGRVGFAVSAGVNHAFRRAGRHEGGSGCQGLVNRNSRYAASSIR